LIFREDQPERALCRLDEMGVLSIIHSDLHCDSWLKAKYRDMRERLVPSDWGLDSGDALFVHLALLAYRLCEPAIPAVCERLKAKREDEEHLLLIKDLQRKLPELVKLDRTSKIYHLLQPYPARVLAVIWLASDSRPVQERVFRYQTEWRLVEPEITGDDLKAMGLEPGPLFGDILRRLREARLNGAVSTRDEEVALVKRLLTSQE
jgi:tRNA nucleotidyltransferase (CCA-adding enzyme)